MSIEGLSKALTLKSGRSKSDQAPEGQQVAALCYRFEKKALRVLLITSRDTGRWVLPKGWMMGGMTAADAAAQEAWEEAGVVGCAADQAVGYFSYDKILPSGDALPCQVAVHAMPVTEIKEKFPEMGQRRRRWVSPKKAAKMVQEPELSKLLLGFAPPLPKT